MNGEPRNQAARNWCEVFGRKVCIVCEASQ